MPNSKPSTKASNLLKQQKAIKSLLSKESDLGGVLIATSFIDDCLKSLLHTHLLDDSKVAQKLLDSSSGVFGSFSVKNDVLYCLGSYGKKTYQDLNKTAEIRNIFAHHHLTANFKNNDVIKLCAELKSPNIYLEAQVDKSNYGDLVVHFKSAKVCFIHTVASLSDSLLQTIISAEHHRI